MRTGRSRTHPLRDRCAQQAGRHGPQSGALIEPWMPLCVESHIGASGGREGVKLAQQVLVTETGTELMSTFPFEAELLGREI